MRFTEADLVHGWRCERCGHGFRVGEHGYGRAVALTADGTEVEGEWVCAACWLDGGFDAPH